MKLGKVKMPITMVQNNLPMKIPLFFVVQIWLAKIKTIKIGDYFILRWTFL